MSTNSSPASAVVDRLEFAKAIAVEAGRLAHTGFGTSVTSAKGTHDVVTEMDGEVERLLRASIARRYPDDTILGEEGGGSAGARAWILDPIDGTANYARGIPHYCVSVAYVEEAVPVVGVLYDPSHDWLYAASRGGGATRNGERLAVSACTDMRAATVECGWSTRRSTAAYIELVQRVMNAGCAIRRAGSGALGLADVAAGRVEAYCELHINSWDCAAGILLVTEAGGSTNDFFAGEGIARGNPLLACNAALCATLADVAGIPIRR